MFFQQDILYYSHVAAAYSTQMSLSLCLSPSFASFSLTHTHTHSVSRLLWWLHKELQSAAGFLLSSGWFPLWHADRSSQTPSSSLSHFFSQMATRHPEKPLFFYILTVFFLLFQALICWTVGSVHCLGRKQESLLGFWIVFLPPDHVSVLVCLNRASWDIVRCSEAIATAMEKNVVLKRKGLLETHCED